MYIVTVRSEDSTSCPRFAIFVNLEPALVRLKYDKALSSNELSVDSVYGDILTRHHASLTQHGYNAFELFASKVLMTR